MRSKPKNVVFMTAVVIPGMENRSRPYSYGINSWKRWCAKHEVELVICDELIHDNEVMKVNYHRYYAPQILKNSNIEYDQLLITDADSIIHPDTPNMFNLTDGKYTVTRSVGSYDWICRSMENYSKFVFDGYTFDIFKYFNAGFQIISKKHEYIWDQLIDFYFRNKELILYMQKNYGVGTDQPIINFLVHQSGEDLTYLPYEYCAADLHRLELLDEDLTFTKAFPGIYQFNAIPNNHNAEWTNYFMEKTYKHLYDHE